MAKVTISNSELQVSIGAFESIQALQASFSIPLAQVRGATEDPNYIRSGIGIRSPGTGFPGMIAKGTFRKPGEKTLSLWSRGEEVVVVVLENSKWDRLVLGCEDSRQLANQINAAISQ